MAFPTTNGRPRAVGFTLIELLVVLAILATLLTLVSPRYFHRVDQAKVETLKQQLQCMRRALDEYHADKNLYPGNLQALVDAGYLRSIPVDPYTEQANTWVLHYAHEGNNTGITDVQSGYEQAQIY